MRKYIFFLWAAMLILAPPVSAQEESADAKQEESTAETEQVQEDSEQKQKLDKCLAEFDEFQQELTKKAMKIQAEMADKGPEAMMEAMQPLQEEMTSKARETGAKVLEIAAQAMEDMDTSLEAIEWVFSGANDSELTRAAGELLVRYHLDNERIPEVLSGLRMPTQASHDLFENVIEKSENRKVRALATLGFLEFMGQALQFAPMADDERLAKAYPDVVAYLKSDTIAEMNDEVILDHMKKLDEEYGDVEVDGSTISEAISGEIRKIEIRARVAVGKVAPEIEGPDIDGTDFKLSDYRGKVVMLDFWGDW